MKFDLLGIVLMIISIALGNIGGNMLTSFIGFGGGIIGVFIVGLVVYAIYTLISGGKLAIMDGVIFAVLIYVAQLIGGIMGGFVGVGGGLLMYVVIALVMSILWGWIGGKKGAAKSPLKL